MFLPAATAHVPYTRAGFSFTPAQARIVRGERYDCVSVFVPDGESHLAARLPHHSTRNWCDMANGTCSVPGCGKAEQLRRGMCRVHYRRQMAHGNTDDPARFDPVCTVDGCDRPSHTHGICMGHHNRLLRGLPLDTPFKPRRKNGEPSAECSFPGCARPVVGNQLCQTHCANLRAGKPLVPIYEASPSTVCSVPGCGRKRGAGGNTLLCGPHLARKYKYGDPLAGPPVRKINAPGTLCSCAGCERLQKRRGMCLAHYQRFMSDKPVDGPIAERRSGGSYTRNAGSLCNHEDGCAAPATRKGMCEKHYRRATGQGATRAMTRRARMYAGPHEDITGADYAALLAATETCYLCGKTLASPIEFDHVIPLARGGRHVLANIKPTHKRCNRVKWASLPPGLTVGQTDGGG
jgi:5-methylcytosine-specific restriction endonuclease McrA